MDDARSHISMVKILRNFHYIDEKGKDQGINSEYYKINRRKRLFFYLKQLNAILIIIIILSFI